MTTIDVITREVIRGSLEYIAEEMGLLLRNVAYSANIKERMDHSCALFDEQGRMIAQAEHIPVHLGAMPLSVKSIMEYFETINSGDAYILNDPYSGGTHLPDITIVTPIFVGDVLIGFAVSRAHHSDVGGMVPGSMPGNATEIYQEGLIIPPSKLVDRNKINEDILRIILANSRTPRVRKGDIMAQLAANQTGVARVKDLIEKMGIKTFRLAIDEILNYSEMRVKSVLKKFPEASSYAEDYIDNDGVEDVPVKIAVNVKISKNKVIFDFSKSSKQVSGAINCPLAVTLSSSYYVFRAITDPTIPANEGLYRPLEVIAPEGTILNAKKPAATVGGNVETSQRIVDALLKAFSKIIPDKIPAASQGTMNNITIGGVNEKGELFSFYETIGGGYGARPNKDGVDGIHSHMTNTMNTPIEEIERRYPLLVMQYSLRPSSGGLGKYRGGLGIIRSFKPLVPVVVSLLGDRQKFAPWGLNGGSSGAKGAYYKIALDGTKIKLPSKGKITLRVGELLVIETPGGGGWGPINERDEELIKEDLLDEKVTTMFGSMKSDKGNK